MLVLDNEQGGLLEGWVPPKFLKLSDELAYVYRGLEDARIPAPFRQGAQTKGGGVGVGEEGV